MPDYKNGKIYKIESLSGGCVYYGSTTLKYLSTRMAIHRQSLKRGHNISSSKVLQYDDAKIYLVELYPCNMIDELLKREGWYIRNNECVNKCIAGRTQKERSKQYYIDNKQAIQKYKKQYRIDNKEKIREHQNQKHNCECGGKYTHTHKTRHLKSKKHKKFINQ